MTATGHALIGALIAGKFHNPALAIPLSFASHFACDLIPHWDSATHWRKKSGRRFIGEAAFDVVLSLVLSFLLYSIVLQQNNYVLLFLSVFAAQLPDWLTAPYFMFHMNILGLTQIAKLQMILQAKLDKPWGIVTQIITIAATYFVLYRF